jgi:hypothetical protein
LAFCQLVAYAGLRLVAACWLFFSLRQCDALSRNAVLLAIPTENYSAKLHNGISMSHPRRQFLSRRPLAIESLERRVVLAGNVTAFVAGGSLFLRGDNAGNGVVITPTGSGAYQLTGVDRAGSPTTINGHASATLAGVNRDFIVNLNNGDDLLGIATLAADLAALDLESKLGLGFTGSPSIGFPTPASIPGNLIVNGGNGKDGIGLVVDVRGNTIIATGNQDDSIATRFSQFEHDLIITTDKGSDAVSFNQINVTNTVRILTGDDADKLSLLAFNANNLFLDTGAGNDGTPGAETSLLLNSANIARDARINTGAGNDSLVLYVDALNLSVDGGLGNDRIDMEPSSIGKDAVIFGGSGNDTLLVHSDDFVIGRNLLVDAGSGDDTVEVSNIIVLGNMTIVLGTGNDNLFVAGSNIQRDSFIDAGSGNDSVWSHNNDYLAHSQLFMGSGDDKLRITINRFAVSPILRGGSGKNDKAALYSNFPFPGSQHVVIGAQDFESVVDTFDPL